MSDPRPHPGYLVAFEGIDGAGKTTQAALLAEHLRALGFEVITSKEPTDGPWGRIIRRSATLGRLLPEEELNAFLEDRKMHVRDLIGPGLAAGAVVIVDRYYPSTVAYQGARGMDPATLLAVNEAIAPRPDLTVFLDVEVDVGLARVDSRGGANLFEKTDALQASLQIFRNLHLPGLVRVDGTGDVREVEERVLAAARQSPLGPAMAAAVERLLGEARAIVSTHHGDPSAVDALAKWGQGRAPLPE